MRQVIIYNMLSIQKPFLVLAGVNGNGMVLFFATFVLCSLLESQVTKPGTAHIFLHVSVRRQPYSVIDSIYAKFLI